MNPCANCKKPATIKCCHNCKRDADNCGVDHVCGDDCPGWAEVVKTNGDFVRGMTDEQLAELFCAIIQARDELIVEKLHKQGIHLSLEKPSVYDMVDYIALLKRPARTRR